MAYRSLLVHLDGDAGLERRIRIAARLAHAHGAHVTGVAAGAPAETAPLCKLFRERLQELGVTACDLRPEEDEPRAVLARHGAHVDLGIFAASPSGIDVDGVAGPFFLTSGRPALVVPDGGPELAVATPHVVVAWDGSRPANRAIADALPWLRHAREVEVVCFDKAEEARFSRLELNDLGAWLDRHGVTARVVQHPAQWSVAQALQTWIANTRCDLLVMGAYGHGHLRETVIGGVTRSLLSAAPVPILVSH